MSDKKDITDNQKDRNLSVFSNGTSFNPFGSNVAASKAYERSERIVAAVYLVTKNIPESEPLRMKIRELSNRLIALSSNLKDGFRSPQEQPRELLELCTRELVTLIRLLAIAGYTSKQNAQIIIGAIEDLVGFLRQAQYSLLSDSTQILKEDLLPQESTPRSGVRPFSSFRRGGNTAETAEPEQPVRSEKHSTRQETILTLLRKTGPLGIKDIATHLPDCGEKTVQRELAHLVDQKVISKEGKKRWSRYSVVR